MLTVLLKWHDGGNEVILSADSVEFVPKRETANGSKQDPGPGLIVRNGKDDHRIPASERHPELRDVFVMNEAGSTVARYTL